MPGRAPNSLDSQGPVGEQASWGAMIAKDRAESAMRTKARSQARAWCTMRVRTSTGSSFYAVANKA